MGEYYEFPLGELVKIKGGKRLPKGAALQLEPTSHPYIRVRDMGTRYIDKDVLEYVPNKVFQKINRYIVQNGDIIISIVGTIGLVSLIDLKLDQASQTENCAKLTGLDHSDALYLYYFLISKIGQQRIYQGTVGAVQAKLPLYSIEALSVIWPEKDKRNSIAHILGKLDDKIELNRQMNQTLEAMAQALFKSWFVDFDPVLDNTLEAGTEIPDSLQAMAEKRQLVPDSKKLLHTNPALAAQFPSAFVFNEVLDKWVPEGWGVKKIKNIGKVITGNTPSSKKPHHFGNIYPFVTPTDFKNFFKLVITSDRKLSQEGFDENIKRVLPDGSVLVTCIGSDMGKVVLTKTQCFTNQQINSVVPNKELISSEYLYQFFHWNYDLLRTLAFGGSTMPILNKTDFENINILTPPKETIIAVTNSFKEFDNKIFNNLKQIETHTQLRDTLLPELISGRVRVS
jgi:type I restriction enzyme S subunit